MNDHLKEFIAGDNRTLVFEDTLLKFSHPVPYGETNTSLGWLLMRSVEYKEVSIIRASDIQGSIL